MMYSTATIFEKGLDCLIEHMGIVEAEQFIAAVKRENFDYTVWQREHFDRMAPGQIMEGAAEYAKKHPYKGKGIKL